MSNWDRRTAYFRPGFHIILGVILIIAGLIVWETVYELFLFSIFGMTLIAIALVKLRDRQLGDRLNNALLFATSGIVILMWLM